MTRLVSIKAVSIAVFCIATVIASSSQTSKTVPRIVKVLHLKNQTGSIAPITLYTPRGAGLFRVSVFMVLTVGNGVTGSICPTFTFTDTVGPAANSGVFCLSSDTTGNSTWDVAVIESVAGAPITTGTQAYSGTAGSAYNVDVVVEALPEPSEE